MITLRKNISIPLNGYLKNEFSQKQSILLEKLKNKKTYRNCLKFSLLDSIH